MGRPHDCAKLIKEGRSPAQIASELGISTGSVKQYLYVAVGFGLMRRSDILFSINREVRQKIDAICEQLTTKDPALVKRAASSNMLRTDPGEIDIYLSLEREDAFTGDMYCFIAVLETTLHRLIEKILKKEYGDEEQGWWRKGVPCKVRKDCATAREEDPGEPASPYCYTTLIHLKEIIEKDWKVFEKYLPKPLAGKGKLAGQLNELNRIRNKVMHPVRHGRPRQEEFDFVRELHDALGRDRWRSLGA